jgi:hypothetical protein
MNKFIPALIFILSFCALPDLLLAQENRPASIEGRAVYSVPSTPTNTSPEKTNGPVTAPTDQQKTKVLTHPLVTPKTIPVQLKKGTNLNTKTAGSGSPGFVLDNEGNNIKILTPAEKSQQIIEKEQIQIGKNTPEHNQEIITHTNFQVVATQEIIPVSDPIISERPLKNNSDKKVIPAEVVPSAATTSTPKIGKVDFLKQYAADLKIQIEKNKNDPNYPLQEKQSELKSIEDLLKEE